MTDWTIPKRPNVEQLESPQAKVRGIVIDLLAHAESTLSFASQRRDHIPVEVTDALARAVQAATEAKEAMTQ